MRISKKKSSLALALMALLTVVVGVAWAINDVDWGAPTAPSVFDYSNTYSTGLLGSTTGGDTNYFFVSIPAPFADYPSPGTALAAGVGPGVAMTNGAWGIGGNVFSANKLEVSRSSMTISQPTITFVANPANFEKLGAGKLIFSAANFMFAALATTVTAGTLEVQNNDSIGMGAITVASGANFIAAGNLSTARGVDNAGTITINTGGTLTPDTINGTGSAVINGTLDLLSSSSTSLQWALSGAGFIKTRWSLTLDQDNRNFTGTIEPIDNAAITAETPTALGSGLFDFTGKTNVIVTYDAATPSGTVATKFNAGADTSSILSFETSNPLTLTGDSSAFNGTLRVTGGTVMLSGAKIGTSPSIRNLTTRLDSDKTLELGNGASVYSETVWMQSHSILRFDLTGAAPKFDADTLLADPTASIDIVLNAAPASGYLNFTVGTMTIKPNLTISDGFIAQWDGNRIKITADSNNPAPSPNVSPATARFDGDNPMDLKFLLRGAALTASNNEKLRIYADAVLLTNSSYAIERQNMTLLASFLKTLADGNHTITLMNDTAQVGKITLTITNGGNGIVDGGGSSGCNAGAVFPMALMLLAPLALLHKKD